MKEPNHIVFFDGFCNLCNRAVNFLMKIDGKKILKYAPLSGSTATNYNLSSPKIEKDQTVIYIRSQKIYERSDAAIFILVDIFLLF